MNIYELDQDIKKIMDEAPVNPETGELEIKEELLPVLNAELKLRDKKITNLIGYRQDLNGDISKIDAEISRLKDLKQFIQNKQNSIERFLDYLHQGESKDYGIFSIRYRKSTRVKGYETANLPREMTTQEWIIRPDKKAIKKALKAGMTFEGWELEEINNIQIK